MRDAALLRLFLQQIKSRQYSAELRFQIEVMNSLRIFTLLMLAPVMALAADSTSATQIKLFTPYGPGGLSKTLSVAETVNGNCFAESIADSSRPDAWRCSAGNAIHDPCFANIMSDSKTLACARSPWDGKVTIMNVTTPPDSGKRKEIPRSQAMPWALDLGNGDHCSLFTGATAPIAGMRINYGCPGGGQVVGDIDRSQAVWKVFYQKEGAPSLDQIDVTVAWY